LQSNQGLQLIKDQGNEASFEAALNALAKALKAMNFYPQDHPLREESITAALLQLKPLLEEKELILLWSRDACSVAERAALRSNSATAKSLARDMLTRKIQRLILLPDLSAKDLKAFLSLFTVDTSDILSRGGIEKAIARAGITTIAANEVDLEVLKNQSELMEEESEASTEALSEGESAGSASAAMQTPETRENDALVVLLTKLKEEQEEQQYLQLVREVIHVAEKLKKTEIFAPLTAALEVLLLEHSSPGRNSAQKEMTKYAVEQITEGSMTAFLLDQVEQRSEAHEELLGTLCATIGKSLTYPLIQRLCIAESLHGRKTFAKALTKTGEAGVPALVSMLKDERWHVVRNMITILGEINCPESVKALQMTARHPEAKVRKEVVKSLLRIAPQAGENTLVSMLDDNDKDVVRQVIFSLGALRSKAAIRPLLEIITASDTFLKEIELKKLAVSAIGRIGDRQASESLMEILISRRWLAPRRWLELKTVAATALGQLGDESALPLLKQLSKLESPLGEACSDAADNLERVVK